MLQVLAATTDQGHLGSAAQAVKHINIKASKHQQIATDETEHDF